MTIPPRYATPAAFRRAADQRLKAHAKAAGRPFREVKREFVYQRFLARLWASEDHQPLWVLKGGVGLLARLPGARFSQDIDLVNLAADADAAVAEIREVGRRDLGDYLRFEVKSAKTMSVDGSLQLSIDVNLGATRWESLKVDISLERHYVAQLEQVTPSPVIDIDGLPPLPTYHLYPIADQVADKVSAMYELHGGAGYPSSRFRDLVDLVLVIGARPLEAAILGAALEARKQNARSPIELPSTMREPGPGWADGYMAIAIGSFQDKRMHSLDWALAYVGDCLNPILDRTIDHGTWNPAEHRWEDGSTASG